MNVTGYLLVLYKCSIKHSFYSTLKWTEFHFLPVLSQFWWLDRFQHPWIVLSTRFHEVWGLKRSPSCIFLAWLADAKNFIALMDHQLPAIQLQTSLPVSPPPLCPWMPITQRAKWHHHCQIWGLLGQAQTKILKKTWIFFHTNTVWGWNLLRPLWFPLQNITIISTLPHWVYLV